MNSHQIVRILQLLLVVLPYCYGIKELLTFSDLQGLDSSPEDVLQAFRRKFGKTPDGISLNYENYHGHSITSKYRRWCYKILGMTKYTSEKSSKPTKAVVGDTIAYNRGESDASVSVTVSGTWSESLGYTSSITTGMTFTTSFTIAGVFSYGASFNFQATAGRSKTNTFARTITSSVEVKVPPKSKKKVTVAADISSVTMHFQKHISVSGYFGANFHYKVRGHYYWFLPADSCLPKTAGEITGKVFGTKALKTYIEIEDAIPLEESEM